MRLAVFGGTGRVGRRVLEDALAAGHAVRALVRDPARLTPRPGLVLVPGDVTDPDAVQRTVGDAAAVISATFRLCQTQPERAGNAVGRCLTPDVTGGT